MDIQKMMGRASELKITIDVKWWDATKLALWRSKSALEIAAQQASEIAAHCHHVPGCAGDDNEHEPCCAECPDRETRMSALVILNAARQLAPMDARKPAQGPYVAPSREYFSAIVAELASCQAQLEAMTQTIPLALPSPAIQETAR